MIKQHPDTISSYSRAMQLRAALLLCVMLLVPIRQYAQFAQGVSIEFLEQCESSDADADGEKQVNKNVAEADDFIRDAFFLIAQTRLLSSCKFKFSPTFSDTLPRDIDPPPEV